jgi:hypothetical protein
MLFRCSSSRQNCATRYALVNNDQTGYREAAVIATGLGTVHSMQLQTFKIMESFSANFARTRHIQTHKLIRIGVGHDDGGRSDKGERRWDRWVEEPLLD